MGASKHMPGPWEAEVHELSEGVSAIVYDARGQAVADHLDEPTASLIAAAPDYDAFAEKALPLLEVLHSTCTSADTRKTVWSCILAGRASLAKARGGQ